MQAFTGIFPQSVIDGLFELTPLVETLLAVPSRIATLSEQSIAFFLLHF